MHVGQEVNLGWGVGVCCFFPMYRLCEITDGEKQGNVKALGKYEMAHFVILGVGG